MSTRKQLFVTISLLIFSIGESARILGIFHVPSRSHHILGSSLLKALAARGHDVTMVSPYPFNYEIRNYRDIFLEELLQFKEENLQDLFRHNSSLSQQLSLTADVFKKLSNILLSHNEIQKLKEEHFDLIIQFAVGTEGLLGLAHHFQAPVILFSTVGSVTYLNKFTGNTLPPSFVPNDLVISLPSNMSFWQRLLNTVTTWLSYLVYFPIVERYNQELLTKHFPEAPPLEQLYDRVALVFVNAHYSIESPRPYVPNLIPVGGIHVEEPKQLVPELKQFLDESKGGAIFFSLGSNVKIADFPREKLHAIINSLGKTSMNILFKSDIAVRNAPPNIKFYSWLPQSDILAHPNLKIFISHGGLLSTIEAIYHGVPLIGIPVFGDQETNVADAVHKGYAIRLDVDDITEDTLTQSIEEILTNPKYRDNIQLRSSLLRDQPVKPLDNAVYWVEHVLRYKGADHLKNAGAKLSFFQYYSLDVLSFLLVAILIFLKALQLILKVVWRAIKRRLRIGSRPREDVDLGRKKNI